MGEAKEWKIRDSLGHDFKNGTHRHLSHLVGWYPGYSISSFLGGYTNATIQNAVATSLYSIAVVLAMELERMQDGRKYGGVLVGLV